MTSCDRSHMRPLVRIFDTASQGISPASSVHPGGPLLLATTNAQAPSADMLSALDDTSMLQHLNRGHRARNEHRAASPTINVNHLKHCRAFRDRGGFDSRQALMTQTLSTHLRSAHVGARSDGRCLTIPKHTRHHPVVWHPLIHQVIPLRRHHTRITVTLSPCL